VTAAAGSVPAERAQIADFARLRIGLSAWLTLRRWAGSARQSRGQMFLIAADEDARKLATNELEIADYY
jgi:hypothetical protein